MQRNKHTYILIVLATAFSLSSCDCDGTDGMDAGFDGHQIDGGTKGDVSKSDPSDVKNVPGSSECAWEPGVRPTAELPPEHTKEYTIELERWEISNENKDPIQTRQRMNEAIKWATENGFDKIIVPPGTYLVGENTNDIYSAGIDLQANMTFELSEGTVIKMAPNDRWNYCVINVDGNDNITIRGGEVVGDRSNHTYNEEGKGHDEGHGICVWSGVSHVLIEDIELHELTGDGVLIVGVKGNDADKEEKATQHVTIRNTNIHHNRRQGVSIVGGHNIVVENNHIHHIEGTSPQFGIDIEGAGRTDKDILIYQNNFHNNAGGDIVTSTGRNVWIEENVMTQCQVDEDGNYDPSLPCLLERQVDGPIIHWTETDNVIINNEIRMSIRTVNGFWGVLGYTGGANTPPRENPVGNYIAGNTFYDSGIHMANNSRYFIANNTIHEGQMLGFRLTCTRLEDNRMNVVKGENYKLRNVAGKANGNLLNRTEGAPTEGDIPQHFPMSEDAPYRNSSPVFW